jgi:hypothetical protein
MYRKVDPAALLFAIFTVTFSPLASLGPWDPLNTVVAFVVGVVLAVFTWPRYETLKDESGEVKRVDGWMPVAQALAYGLVIAIGIAWIVQLIWVKFAYSLNCPRGYPDNNSNCPKLNHISRT